MRRKVEFDPKLRRWKVFRTEIMSDIFNAIKRDNSDFLQDRESSATPTPRIFSTSTAKYNNSLRMIQYTPSARQADEFRFTPCSIAFSRP